MQEKKRRMHHIGQLLQKAIDDSGYSTSEIARQMGKAVSTLFRRYNIPNLSPKQVIEVNEAAPYINLKTVFESLEENLGYAIEQNPYRKEPVPQPRLLDQTPGISISIDSKKYAGYAIPPHLENLVEEAIFNYNKKLSEEK